jgi:hypothetical protein
LVISLFWIFKKSIPYVVVETFPFAITPYAAKGKWLKRVDSGGKWW